MEVVLTNVGAALLESLAAGGSLNLSKVEVGSGVVASGETPATFTQLKNKVANGAFGVTSRNGSVVTIVAQYRNDMNGGLQTGFALNEIGYYAKNASDVDVLVYYAHLGGDTQYINPFVAGNGVEIHNYKITANISLTTGISSVSTAAWITGDDAQTIFSNTYGALLTLTGTTAPTTATVGHVGQLYLDTAHDDGHLYICVAATTEYTWKSVLTGYHVETTVQSFAYYSTTSAITYTGGEATIICIGGGGGGAGGEGGIVVNSSSGTIYGDMHGGGGGGSGYVTSVRRTLIADGVYQATIGAGGASGGGTGTMRSGDTVAYFDGEDGSAGGASSFVATSGHSDFQSVVANGGSGGDHDYGRAGTGRNDGTDGVEGRTNGYPSSTAGYSFSVSLAGGVGGAGYEYDGVAYGTGGNGCTTKVSYNYIGAGSYFRDNGSIVSTAGVDGAVFVVMAASKEIVEG